MIAKILATACILTVLFMPESGNAAGAPTREVNITEQSLDPMNAEALSKLLEDSKGKVVMINFFASWCPPCREEVPSLVRLRKRHGEDQLVLVGLSVDQEPEDLKQFLGNMPVNYPVFMAEAEVAYMYGVNSIPHNVVYNKAGELVGNQPGLIPEQDLRRVLDGLVREK